MKKRILVLLFLLIPALCFGAWDETKPADNEKLKDTPALLRANFAAIMLGTDADLLITNAKVAANAAIVDTKLAQITTPSKVSGAAITALSSIPQAAGACSIANGCTGQTTATAALTALLPSQTSNSGKVVRTNGTVQSWGYPEDLTIASQAQGDILYYTGSLWSRLAAGTANQVLKTGGAGANPSWGLPNDLSIASQAQGDILYFDNANWVRLPAGTSGYFLKTQGAGANPTWASPSNSSNLVFFKDAHSTLQSEYIGISLQGGVPTAQYKYTASQSQTYVTHWTGRFKKIAGISTITVDAEIWAGGNTDSTDLKVDVGGQYIEINKSSGMLTPAWVSGTIDVSSLTNGTIYDVTVQMKMATNGCTYCGKVYGYGS